MTLGDIETLAHQFAIDHSWLKEKVDKLQHEVQKLKQKHLKGIQCAANQLAVSRAALTTAIEAGPELFVRPRTLVLHGIKVGWQKGRGKLEWDDTQGVVDRIRALLPDQADVLIIIEEKPAKKALELLPAVDLKKLGVRLIESGDEVVIKPADNDVDKLVTALLAEMTKSNPS